VALGFGCHGRTIGTLSITGNQVRKKGNGPYLPGVAFGPAPYCYRCPLGLTYPTCEVACAHALKDVIRQQTSGDVAAFIAEPVLGEGGIVAPPAEYFDVAARIFHEEGALFIVDEVQTGFGRTGRMFGIDHAPGSKPDIVAMAKGIASGFPLGAFMAREPVSEAMKPGDHLSTFGGNPISCAAALANLEVLREEKPRPPRPSPSPTPPAPPPATAATRWPRPPAAPRSRSSWMRSWSRTRPSVGRSSSGA
jgi:4-aminobutyrate aminotransferase-like enzyme